MNTQFVLGDYASNLKMWIIKIDAILQEVKCSRAVAHGSLQLWCVSWTFFCYVYTGGKEAARLHFYFWYHVLMIK